MSTPDQPTVDEGAVTGSPPEATQLPADPNAPQPTQPIVVDPADPNAPPVATQLPADVTPADPNAPVATQPIAPEAPAETPVQEQPEGPGPDMPTQLPTIPIRDESGSDIAPPNLVQPPVELPPAPSEAPTDPALEEPAPYEPPPEEEPVLDAEGNEVPPPETVPTVEEPDVTTVDPGTGEGEYIPPLTSEDWVVLGQGDAIPWRVRGRRAIIVSAPRVMIPVGQTADVWITVRVRDDTNAMVTVPLSEVTIDRGGRTFARG